MNNDLNQFVRKALGKGATREQITKALSAAGWQDDEVKNALAGFADVEFVVPVPKRRPYTSAREAFMYLVMFLTLYLSAYNFGALLFNFVDRAFPDPAQAAYIVQDTSTAIRFALASIIIAFPIFLWVSWLVGKMLKQDPDKRASKIRKWLTYITLFAAAGLIIGDLISLVFGFLNGDLTLAFGLKVLVIGAIAGTIFGYYLWDLRGEEKES